MSEPRLAEPLPDSPLQVEEIPHGIVITLPLHEFRYHLGGIAMGLFFGGLGLFLFFMGWRSSEGETRELMLGFLILYILIVGTISALAVDMAGRRAIVRVAGDEILVQRRGHLWRRTWRWQRSRLRWITAYQGLQIIAVYEQYRLRTCRLFIREQGNALSRVAQLLRDVLPLSPESSSAPGEIEIELSDHPEKMPGHGFLFAKPGRLAIRHDYLVGYQYEFFPAGALDARSLWRMYRGSGRPIGPEQVQCKIAEDGTACMQIIRSEWPTVWLTVWSEDKTAIQAALARFWGNEEDREHGEPGV